MKYQESEVFFIENRNLHNAPDQYKGMMCAIHYPARGRSSAHWSLCYCWKFLVDRDCLQVFQWIGPTRPNPRRNGTGYVPHFFCGPIAHFTDHFQPKCIKTSGCTLHFLNQIHGQRPGGPPYSYDRVNVIDGCFQCNPDGPDWIVLPVDAKRYFPGEETLSAFWFPKKYMESSPHRLPSHFSLPQSRLEGSPTPCRRLVIENYSLPLNRKYSDRRRRHRTSRMEAWMAPPKFVTFHSDAILYQVVFVEDTPRRLEIDPVMDKGFISIPFFVDIPIE